MNCTYWTHIMTRPANKKTLTFNICWFVDKTWHDFNQLYVQNFTFTYIIPVSQVQTVVYIVYRKRVKIITFSCNSAIWFSAGCSCQNSCSKKEEPRNTTSECVNWIISLIVTWNGVSRLCNVAPQQVNRIVDTFQLLRSATRSEYDSGYIPIIVTTGRRCITIDWIHSILLWTEHWTDCVRLHRNDWLE